MNQSFKKLSASPNLKCKLFIAAIVEDLYLSKYELIKYNQGEFSHLCIRLFFHYKYIYMCVCPRPAYTDCADLDIGNICLRPLSLL